MDGKWALVTPLECCATVVDVSPLVKQDDAERAKLPRYVQDELVWIPAEMLDEYEELTAKIIELNGRLMRLKEEQA